MEHASRAHAPPVIDVTLDGQVLPPPTSWSRLGRLWRALPSGSLPALLVSAVIVAVLAVLLVGLLLVAVPALLVLAIVSALLRGGRARAR